MIATRATGDCVGALVGVAVGVAVGSLLGVVVGRVVGVTAGEPGAPQPVTKTIDKATKSSRDMHAVCDYALTRN